MSFYKAPCETHGCYKDPVAGSIFCEVCLANRRSNRVLESNQKTNELLEKLLDKLDVVCEKLGVTGDQ